MADHSPERAGHSHRAHRAANTPGRPAALAKFAAAALALPRSSQAWPRIETLVERNGRLWRMTAPSSMPVARRAEPFPGQWRRRRGFRGARGSASRPATGDGAAGPAFEMDGQFGLQFPCGPGRLERPFPGRRRRDGRWRGNHRAEIRGVRRLVFACDCKQECSAWRGFRDRALGSHRCDDPARPPTPS